jgi:hypothetical protein
MDRDTDPNPLERDLGKCEMPVCSGRWLLGADGIYRCTNPACEWYMAYADVKDCDLFARWLKDQFPDIDPAEVEPWDIFEVEDQNFEEEASGTDGVGRRSGGRRRSVQCSWFTSHPYVVSTGDFCVHRRKKCA